MRFNQANSFGAFQCFVEQKYRPLTMRTDTATKMSAMVKFLPSKNESLAKNTSKISKDK